MTSHETSAEEHGPEDPKRTWAEEVEVAGHELVEHVERLLQESSTKRAVIRTHEGKELMSVPLTFGLVAGGILTLGAPLLAALGAAAALLGKVRLTVVREGEPPDDRGPENPA